METLYEYWQHNPPVHVTVARYLGIKPKSTGKGNFEDLLAAFPDGSIKG